MVLRSEHYDDVYFSAQDGLAETRHVFLDGNDLSARLKGYDGEFVIGETGFGTGLNFLAAWDLFEAVAGSDGSLHFISFEKYPLSKARISEALSGWGELAGRLEKMLEVYPDAPHGCVEMPMDSRVRLTLIIGDINAEMPWLEAEVECWFLDGFKPSANPDMWSETVFQNMARLSKPGASFATFTSAGFVRRGLAAAGFEVEKRRGFGRKREMCAGRKL